jgi:hypothetical protein
MQAIAGDDPVEGLVGHDARDGIARGIIPGDDAALHRMLDLPRRLVRSPFPPFLGLRVAGIEDKASFGFEMTGDGAKDRGLVLRREKHLESVTGQHDEIEAVLQPEAPCVASYPGHPLTARPLGGDIQHRPGGIDTHDVTIAVLRQRGSEQARPASQVEHRGAAMRQALAVVEMLRPSVLDVVELGEIRIAIKPFGGYALAGQRVLAPGPGTPAFAASPSRWK